MKKLLCTLLITGIWLVSSSFAPDTGELTKEDRKRIISYLKKTKSELAGKIKSLSPEQWNYKPSPETWSVAEICEHILVAESVVLKRVDNLEDKTHKPDLMNSYKEKEKEVIDFVVGRKTKLTAPDRVAPKGEYKTVKEFTRALNERRSKTITYVKDLQKPIKAYYEKFGPIGEVSGYHWLVFLSAHTERHMIQLEEVLKDSKFPS